jgi:hypothetical protein
MIHYKLDILAIQEHMPWNRELFASEITSIERHCDHWGYIVKISRLQILRIDKQLTACHRGTAMFEDGRVVNSRFEISENEFVTFVPVYGVSHYGGENVQANPTQNIEENTILDKMARVQKTITGIINEAKKNGDILYIFGDLQDTPDNSKLFHYGSCRLPKHPLSIIKACETAGLQCSIYQHLEQLEKPIISRHGSKGGRFIDRMYTCQQGIQKVKGISIVADSGVNSDHSLIVSKLDLGVTKFQVSKEKKERIDFKSIMNIPIHKKNGDIHPSLDETVFKGADFRVHAESYKNLQDTINDPSKDFLLQIAEIGD